MKRVKTNLFDYDGVDDRVTIYNSGGYYIPLLTLTEKEIFEAYTKEKPKGEREVVEERSEFYEKYNFAKERKV